MFSFFKKKSKDEAVPAPEQETAQPVAEQAAPAEQKLSWLQRLRGEKAAPPPAASEADITATPQAEEPTVAEDLPAVAEPIPEPAEPEPKAEIVSDTAPAADTSTTPEDDEEEGEIIPAAPAPLEQRQSWMQRLKTGLAKTSTNLTTLFVGAKIDDDLYDELEAALLMADTGVEATHYLLDTLKKKVKSERLTEAEQVKKALRAILIELLSPLQKPMVLGRHQPLVVMIAGVNGAGKTTTIGKLAKHLQAHQQSVLLAAGDTFRAAAREQLAIWGQRNNVTVISQESGDPAAVAFDAVQSGRARRVDVVMIDTAGRLPTQSHLMEELKKVRRVVAKAQASAPHEVLLVIDGNTGQNALAQVKAFDDALQLTGLVVTKLDGTAKGGVLAAVAKTRPVPVYFIGVGEKIEDLQPFVAEEFVDALLS